MLSNSAKGAHFPSSFFSRRMSSNLCRTRVEGLRWEAVTSGVTRPPNTAATSRDPADPSRPDRRCRPPPVVVGSWSSLSAAAYRLAFLVQGLSRRHPVFFTEPAAILTNHRFMPPKKRAHAVAEPKRPKRLVAPTADESLAEPQAKRQRGRQRKGPQDAPLSSGIREASLSQRATSVRLSLMSPLC